MGDGTPMIGTTTPLEFLDFGAFMAGIPLFRATRSLLMPYVPGTDEFRERSERNNARIPSDLKSLLSTPVKDNPMYDVGMTGMTVYHGSPYKFDKFLKAKIGTGEGAQAYGHGLYFAEDPKVAGSYTFAGKAGYLGQVQSRYAKAALEMGGGDKKKAIEALTDLAKTKQGYERQPIFDAINNFDELINGGNLYHVDLPDSKIEKMLDWDGGYKANRAAIDPILAEEGFSANSNGWKAFSQRYGGQFGGGESSGKVVYEFLRKKLGSQEAASAKLHSLGIPGIKYLDQGSRTAGKGTRNFVVFDENDVKILERK